MRLFARFAPWRLLARLAPGRLFAWFAVVDLRPVITLTRAGQSRFSSPSGGRQMSLREYGTGHSETHSLISETICAVCCRRAAASSPSDATAETLQTSHPAPSGTYAQECPSGKEIQTTRLTFPRRNPKRPSNGIAGKCRMLFLRNGCH